MTVWIDQPIWPAHGRLFAHLVSDVSYDELHELARAAGLHPRSFDGDHYDVPEGRWQDAVDAGATPDHGARPRAPAQRVGPAAAQAQARPGRAPHPRRALPQRLQRRRPRRLRRPDAARARPRRDGLRTRPARRLRRRAQRASRRVGLARRVARGRRDTGRERRPRDVRGDRPQAASPGRTALRLRAVHARAPTTTSSSRDKPFLQVFRTRLDDVRPELTDGDDGIHETRWVTPQEYAELCGHLFWWALAVEVFPDLRGLARPLRRTYAAHRGGRHTWSVAWVHL